MHRYKLILISFISVCLFALSSQAAKVVNVKGKKVYVSLDGFAEKGDVFYVLDNKGKKRGIIKIIKAKGTKAVAQKGKGSVKKGWTLLKKTSVKKVERAKKRKEEAQAIASVGNMFWGAMLGFGIDSMTAKIEIATDTYQDTNMSGNGFSAKVLFDYALWPQVWFRGLFGLENFSASSQDSICGDAKNEICEANISYLTLDMWGRYLFTTSNIRPWIGLGFDILFPSSSDSTAIKEDSITSTSLFTFGGGLDWHINSQLYIPVQVEYGFFPSSDEVSANAISIRGGIAYGF